MVFHEVDTAFAALPDFIAWANANGWFFDQAYVQALAEAIRTGGLEDPADGPAAPADVLIDGQTFREGIVAFGRNCRMRALLLEILAAQQRHGAAAKIYAPEQVTPFAELMGRLFGAGFVGSEYLPAAADRATFPHLRHEDIEKLTFKKASFDIYFSSEVMEHIPSIPSALAEARRVLKKGGTLLIMCPFAYGQQASVTKAKLGKDGAIEHLMAPEYHGNPVDPVGGSLVFTIPGWDILDQIRAAGFADVTVKIRSSRRYAVTGAEVAGSFIFKATAA